MHKVSSAAAACAALGLFSITPLTPPAASAPPPEHFVLEAGEHTVQTLIDRSASFLGRNYLYSKSEVANMPNASVRLQQRMQLDARGCEEVVSSLAFSVGFVMVPVDETRGIYEWIAMHGPKRSQVQTAGSVMTPEEVLSRRNLRIPVQVVVPLRFINTTAAVNQLRPFFATGGPGASPITLGAAAQGLLVAGFAREVASVVDVLRMIDAPPGETREVPGRGAAKKVVELSDWRAGVDRRLTAIERQLGKAPEQGAR